MQGDLIERAEYAIEWGSGDQLHRDLLAEVKRLRWQVAHGDSDHMCDECWPVDDNSA